MVDRIDIKDITAGNVNFGKQVIKNATFIINLNAAVSEVGDGGHKLSVFLSYAREDDGDDYDDPEKSLMRRLFNDLTAVGFAVWWDRESMPSRSVPFDKEIATAIRACDRFVLVAGPHAAKSEWVQAELRFARELCKPVTNVLRAGDFDLIPVEIGRVNAIDFRPPRAYAAALSDLIARLQQDAPLGKLFDVKRLPDYHLKREKAFYDARAAICTEAVTPVVISAPPRAVAVYGYGGIGKSTLASALAHDCEVRRTFRDGIVWLEVGQTPTPAALQAALGVTVFGDSRDNYTNELHGRLALSEVLRNKAALIVLDDVWDHQVVRHFPIEETACRLLITTRSGALAEQIEGADIRLGLLTPEEGGALIAKRAGGSPDDPVYREIAVNLGGHTLAIALAGARLKKKGVGYAATILKGLENPTDPFANLNVHKDDKDLNLSKSLAQSLTLLDDDMRRRFRALGVFAVDSTFDAAALAAVWGDADVEAADRAVEELVDAGLLDEGDKNRYSQHRLLRAYARALLIEAGESEAAATRHLTFYADLHGDKRDHTDPDYLRSIDIDLDNLRTALLWGFEHAVETACDLLGALDNYFRVYQTIQVYHPLLQAALEASRRADYTPGQANTLQALGDLSVRVDELEAARGYYDRALPLYEQIGDRLGLANTLQALGDLSVRVAELEAARGYYDRALPLYEQIGARLGLANTLQALGDLSVRVAELEAAREYYDRALPLYEQIGARLGLANTLQALGDLSVRVDELEAARGYYDRALPLYEQIGARLGLANTLQALGDLSVRVAELEAARGYYDRALPLYEQIGARLGLANTLQALGDLSVRVAELEAARGYYDRALPLYEQIGARLGLANTLQALGDLSVRVAELEAARGYYDRAVRLYDDIGARGGAANCWRGLAQVADAVNDGQEADRLYCNALRIQLALSRQHQSYGRILRVWQQEHAALLARYNITSVCDDLPPIEETDSGEQMAQLMQLLVRSFKQGGVDAVRQMLQGRVPDAVIDQLTAQLAEAAEQSRSNAQSTLPKDTIRTLVRNTVAVKTGVPQNLDEWRAQLRQAQADWSARGVDYAIEAAFATALLAILDDQPTSLPDDNPYQAAVAQVIEAIQAYRKEHPDGE